MHIKYSVESCPAVLLIIAGKRPKSPLWLLPKFKSLYLHIKLAKYVVILELPEVSPFPAATPGAPRSQSLLWPSSEHAACGREQVIVWSAAPSSKLGISIEGTSLNLYCLSELQKDKVIVELSKKLKYYRDSEAYAGSYFVQLHCESTHHPTKITDCTILFLGWDFRVLSSWSKHAPRLLLSNINSKKPDTPLAALRAVPVWDV